MVQKIYDLHDLNLEETAEDVHLMYSRATVASKALMVMYRIPD